MHVMHKSPTMIVCRKAFAIARFAGFCYNKDAKGSRGMHIPVDLCMNFCIEKGGFVMNCLVAQGKRMVERVVSSMKVWDISALKLCCVSFGAQLAGLYPALVRGKRKIIWLILFLASLIPLGRTIYHALRDE